MFHGTIMPILVQAGAIVDGPALGGAIISYVNYKRFGDGVFGATGALNSRFRRHEKFGPGAVADVYPISTNWFEQIEQSDFWLTRFNHGLASIPTAKGLGLRQIKDTSNANGTGNFLRLQVGQEYKYFALDNGTFLDVEDAPEDADDAKE